jgi:hypothetical protein
MSLKTLVLFDLKVGFWDTILPNPHRPHRPPCSLTYAEIRNTIDCTNNVLGWLVSGRRTPAIDTLKLSFGTEYKTSGIGRCSQELGPLLKHLEVGSANGKYTLEDLGVGAESMFSLHWTAESFLHDVNLSYNTNLTSIQFAPLNFTVLHETHVAVPSLLAQITSSEVREIAIEIWREDLEEIDWNSIAQLLQRPNFSRLQKLVVYGMRDEYVEKGSCWLMEILPLGRARDKLVLCKLCMHDAFHSHVLHGLPRLFQAIII